MKISTLTENYARKHFKNQFEMTYFYLPTVGGPKSAEIGPLKPFQYD